MKLKKKTIKKMAFLLVLLFTIINCVMTVIGPGKVFAADSFDIGDTAIAGFEGLLNGLAWLPTLVLRIMFLVLGTIIQMLMDAALSAGTGSVSHVTVESVLFTGYTGNKFNGIDFTDVDFFNIGVGGTIESFRTAIAKWYYILRLVSAAILLVMLIYVGIRMALSTVATEQARYKNMLMDWVASLALLFLLHYIIIFIIGVNSALINALR